MHDLRTSASEKRNLQSGQASIFMALFIATMMVLFAFTTNVGMIVHAKINLQNAADAASFAGAAVQARQLTSVAYLNWEMRRALKQFLYYYFVKGTNAQTCFPYNSNGDRVRLSDKGQSCEQRPPDRRYSFAIFDPRTTPEFNERYDEDMMPTVCVIFDEANNYCQKATVAGVPELLGNSSFGAADAIVNTVRRTTRLIIDRKVQDCNSRTDVNREFLAAWLFNLSPQARSIGVGTETKYIFDDEGIEGLGILPRMAMLRGRIDNFEEKLNVNLSNEGLGNSVDRETIMQIGAGGSGQSADYYERTIQAYLSAYNNLPKVNDNGIFSDITMQELIPDHSNQDPSPGLTNEPILAKFNDITTVANFANSVLTGNTASPGSGNTPSENMAGSCEQTREARKIPMFPLGIAKDPSIPTYYAIKLKAKARLLFSPFGEDGTVTLTAYSAAKPFGSRLGIDLSKQLESFALTTGRRGKKDTVGFDDSKFVNLLVSTFDKDSNTQGFASNGHLGYLRAWEMVSVQNELGGESPVPLSAKDRLRLAGAYAPWEIGYYTIPANYDKPESIGQFDFNPFYDPEQNNQYLLQADLKPVNGNSDLSFIKKRVLEYLSGETSSQGPADKYSDFIESVMSQDALDALLGYLENYHYDKAHPIPDPLLNDAPLALRYAKEQGGQNYTVAAMDNAQRRQLTSWSNKKLSAIGQGELSPSLKLGRSGYSVKFISFHSLGESVPASNDPNLSSEMPDNPLQRLDFGGIGSTLQEDLSHIKH